jgi:type IV pilus assembly protein PilY1
LDITDTTNPVYLWSFTDTTKMGETWSDPLIGKVKMSDGSTTGYTDKYVAFFGGGFDSANNNNTGKAIFAVDVATGTKLWEYYNSTGATDDRQYMNFSLPSSPLALDIANGIADGYIDRIYIGDVGGQLWKFDLSAPATLDAGLVNNWTGKRLFAAAPTQANPPAAGEFYPAQAFYGPPTAAVDDAGALWVYLGTGDRDHPNSNSANRFYGIKDNTDMTGSTLNESNLTDVTTSSSTVSQGWYFTLASNEKVLAAADVFNRVVFFSTFIPATMTSCGSGGGTAKLYAIQMTTGYAAMNWSTNQVYASSGSGSDGSSASNTRGKTIGTGIPSKPIVIISDSGTTLTTSVIAATTSQQLPSNPAPPPTAMRRVLYWREIF